jgi:hypothetical protein
MSDERLLSEALRAHAAGGVSTPRPDTPAPPTGSPGTGTGSDGTPSSGRRRFRPLGRVRRPGQPAQAATEQTPTDPAPPDRPRTDQQRADPQRTDQQRTDQPAARSDVPSPRSGAPGLAPPGYARGPILPAPPTTPVRQGPTSGGFGVAGPARPGPPARPAAVRPASPDAGASAGYVAWSAATVTWWSLVAVLAGGVVGGAVGVLSLLLPA